MTKREFENKVKTVLENNGFYNPIIQRIKKDDTKEFYATVLNIDEYSVRQFFAYQYGDNVFVDYTARLIVETVKPKELS